MNKVIKNYLLMALGAIIIGIGVAFVVYGNLGGDAMTTLEQGMHNTFKISLPLAQIIANLFFAFLLFLLEKDRVNIDTIFCPLFISIGCKLSTLVLPSIEKLSFRVLYMLIGIVVIGIGIGIGAQTKSGSNPYDGFVLTLSEKINKKYSLIRPVTDATLLVIGILLHGAWGVGTLMAVFFQGYIANIFIKLFNKTFQLSQKDV